MHIATLILDGNSRNRTILSNHLQDWGLTVEGAANNTDALGKLRAAHQRGQAFHIAFIDMQKAHKDGNGIGKRILDDPELGYPKLVMVRPRGLQRNVSRAADIGFPAFLTKPVRLEFLLKCLVKLTLPEEKQQPEPIVESEANHPVPDPGASGKRILVVEDNVFNQRVIVNLLEKSGYETIVAENGKESLEALKRKPFDLVLMDV